MLSMRWFAQTLPKFKIAPTALIFSGAIICGLVGVFFPEVLGLGTASIVNMLGGEFSIDFVLTILILKILLTSICLASGLFGGIFAPALFIGTAGSISDKSSLVFLVQAQFAHLRNGRSWWRNNRTPLAVQYSRNDQFL